MSADDQEKRMFPCVDFIATTPVEKPEAGRITFEKFYDALGLEAHWDELDESVKEHWATNERNLERAAFAKSIATRSVKYRCRVVNDDPYVDGTLLDALRLVDDHEHGEERVLLLVLPSSETGPFIVFAKRVEHDPEVVYEFAEHKDAYVNISLEQTSALMRVLER